MEYRRLVATGALPAGDPFGWLLDCDTADAGRTTAGAASYRVKRPSDCGSVFSRPSAATSIGSFVNLLGGLER